MIIRVYNVLKKRGESMKRLCIFGLTLAFLFGCTANMPITDDFTKPEINTVEVEKEFFTVEYSYDNMDRGNHDYVTFVHENKIVIDPAAHEIKRGEVVYYETPPYTNENQELDLPDQTIARIVGLPGEKIEIKKGKVYIDGKKLDTFYSEFLVRGMNKEEYFSNANKLHSTMPEETFEENMAATVVPQDSYFILCDQWWRGVDSKEYGPIEFEAIKGKVLGYEK